MWWMFLFGCTPEPVVLQAPDPVRTGMEGEDGPFGAGRLTVHAQARVLERLSYAVYFPADDSGDPHPDLTAVPVVAWVQGGLVPAAQYEWLPQHWATRGFVTVVPDHEFDLAITQPSNAPLALDHLLREQPFGELTTDRSPLGLGGHSLGGVVAAIDWASNPDIAWLLMAASFPAAGTPVEDRAGPVLGLVGDQDGLLTPDEMRDETLRFRDLTFGVQTGMNHFGWTGDGSGGEGTEDGPLLGDLPTLHAQIHTFVDASMDAHLLGDTDAAARLEQPFVGFE